MRYNTVTLKTIYWNGTIYRQGERINNLSVDDFQILVDAGCISGAIDDNGIIETAMMIPQETRARRVGGKR